MKNYYSDYIRHCLRFYVRHPLPATFRSDVDRQNWMACHLCIQSLNKDQQETIREIYGTGDTIADNIYHRSQNTGTQQDSIWKLVHDIERQIAQRRGLV